MDFEIVSRTKIEGNSEELVLKTEKNNLQHLGYILETVEGMCHYTTIDKEETLLKVVYTLDFKEDVARILQSLKENKN
ncbi:MAG: DUF4911 domain-containing protein [Candidatus Celaenobacter antarcticus]|nr:DUF4911 domain-containing protein [Candidatus Celaenobacter antarcticus]MDP8314753.1 DUF4911 domain-containing protein [Candidatus Celaenobacter antarcticus]